MLRKLGFIAVVAVLILLVVYLVRGGSPDGGLFEGAGEKIDQTLNKAGDVVDDALDRGEERIDR